MSLSDTLYIAISLCIGVPFARSAICKGHFAQRMDMDINLCLIPVIVPMHQDALDPHSSMSCVDCISRG